MLLLDDDDELPDEPEEEERALAARLGPEGLRAIDATLERCAQLRWFEVARVIADALEAGGYPLADGALIDLHTRRVIALVEAGVLLVQGDPRRPRWSEVRRLPPGEASPVSSG